MNNLKSKNLAGVAIDKLHRRVKKHQSTIGIIGLGYVGLPLSIRFSEEGFKVLGFDIDEEKVKLLNSGKSYIANSCSNLLSMSASARIFFKVDIVCNLFPGLTKIFLLISSNKIKTELGFVTKHTIRDAVEDLCTAFEKGLLPNSLDDQMYFNIKRMQNLELV